MSCAMMIMMSVTSLTKRWRGNLDFDELLPNKSPATLFISFSSPISKKEYIRNKERNYCRYHTYDTLSKKAIHLIYVDNNNSDRPFYK